MALRRWIPPALLDAVGSVLPDRFQRFEVVSDWDDAERRSIGYEQSTIQTHNPTAAANGEADHRLTSRDLQFIAAVGICLASSRPGPPVRVLDFGGAFGHYFDVAVSAFPNLSWEWAVVETPGLVSLTAGTKAQASISWTSNLDAKLGERWDFVLASGSLHCVLDPMGVLAKLAGIAPYVLLTRLPLWPVDHHLPAVQRLSRWDQGGAYPLWFFSEAVFLEEVRAIGDVVLRFDVPEDSSRIAGHRNTYAGMLIRTKDSS
jgi:putative methyltransferase (TIGR04325 family)